VGTRADAERRLMFAAFHPNCSRFETIAPMNPRHLQLVNKRLRRVVMPT
jgi:hypothetical protein